ncbi:MAG: NUDIX hydrolase [bacterium]|nr:NUDIX hydrolase [bacterium]
MPDDWERLGDETLLRYLVFHVRKSRRRSPRTGAEIGFFLIDTPNWVTVVALTTDDRIVLVRQFRHGSERALLEVPGGLIDPHEDDPAEAAVRELREESGYEAGRLELLGDMNPNPAIFSNRCYAYLATDCRKVAELDLDPGEDIEVVTVPVAELDERIRRGEIEHSICLGAIALWRAGSGANGAGS